MHFYFERQQVSYEQRIHIRLPLYLKNFQVTRGRTTEITSFYGKKN